MTTQKKVSELKVGDILDGLDRHFVIKSINPDKGKILLSLEEDSEEPTKVLIVTTSENRYLSVKEK